MASIIIKYNIVWVKFGMDYNFFFGNLDKYKYYTDLNASPPASVQSSYAVNDEYVPLIINFGKGVVPIKVLCGETHYAILCSDNSLWMAGNNDCGQLCIPITTNIILSFTKIKTNVQYVYCKNNYTYIKVNNIYTIYGDSGTDKSYINLPPMMESCNITDTPFLSTKVMRQLYINRSEYLSKEIDKTQNHITQWALYRRSKLSAFDSYYTNAFIANCNFINGYLKGNYLNNQLDKNIKKDEYNYIDFSFFKYYKKKLNITINMYHEFYNTKFNDIWDEITGEIKYIFGELYINKKDGSIRQVYVNGRTKINKNDYTIDNTTYYIIRSDIKKEDYITVWKELESNIDNYNEYYVINNQFNGKIVLEKKDNTYDTYYFIDNSNDTNRIIYLQDYIRVRYVMPYQKLNQNNRGFNITPVITPPIVFDNSTGNTTLLESINDKTINKIETKNLIDDTLNDCYYILDINYYNDTSILKVINFTGNIYYETVPVTDPYNTIKIDMHAYFLYFSNSYTGNPYFFVFEEYDADYRASRDAVKELIDKNILAIYTTNIYISFIKQFYQNINQAFLRMKHIYFDETADDISKIKKLYVQNKYLV